MLETSSGTVTRRDRRSSTRHSVEIPARFSTELLYFDGTVERDGVAADLSDGGLFLHSDLLQLLNAPVWVRLLVPDGPLTVEGAVAWVCHGPPKGPGMGITVCRTGRCYQRLLSVIASLQSSRGWRSSTA